MSKKEIRKELELVLIKSLEEVLNKKNAVATKKIRKNTHVASKMVAKKFLKMIKNIDENKIVTPKKSVKKAIVSFKNAGTPSVKKRIKKIKIKVKK